jgi:hypothetical protein
MFSAKYNDNVYYARMKGNQFVVRKSGEQEEHYYDMLEGFLREIKIGEIQLDHGTSMPTWRIRFQSTTQSNEFAQLQAPIDSRYAEDFILKIATYLDMYQQRMVEDKRVALQCKMSFYTKRVNSSDVTKLLVSVDGYKVFGRYRTPSPEDTQNGSRSIEQVPPKEMVVAVDGHTGKEIAMSVVYIPAHNWISGALNRKVKVLSEERLAKIQELVDRINTFASVLYSPQF